MSENNSTPDHVGNQKGSNISLLDLPEPVLDSVLIHFSPIDLCIMSQACISLRDRCRSDHIWARIIKEKWGRVIGDVAYKEWRWHLTIAKEENLLNEHIQNGSLGSISGVWPNICLGSFLEDFGQLISCSRKNNFMMSMYISLESGKFWFPAQIYRGAVLCNALLSYESKTDHFQARQQTGGWRFLGSNISWDMVRLPLVETPFVLHVSDSLDDLKPGDHIEIQRRPSRGKPYDWWYANIGHLDSCDETENQHCRCYLSERTMENKQIDQVASMEELENFKVKRRLKGGRRTSHQKIGQWFMVHLQCQHRCNFCKICSESQITFDWATFDPEAIIC
ncbi:hypothetical protein L6164_002049 [Bauhinia variegata]|uniref:Uncharacterized protein n=1 Tax=Bauhinia variegata TaxID=167791 RepID=A0ACB9PYV1_BAUVA|nr:hypothetical protein L6164_002049 [Bauhinia variegata]